MKKIEMLALVGTVLYIVAMVLQVALQTFGVEFIKEHHCSFLMIILLSLPRTLSFLIFNIAIAIWLAVIAKRDHRPIWIWVLFSVVFGLMAPILFYGMRIHDKLTNIEKRREQSSAGDSSTRADVGLGTPEK